MTDTSTRIACLDLVGVALRLKLGHELGRHRVAYYALCDLAERLQSLRPALQTLAASSEHDHDVDLDDLLTQRWPAASIHTDLDDAILALRTGGHPC